MAEGATAGRAPAGAVAADTALPFPPPEGFGPPEGAELVEVVAEDEPAMLDGAPSQTHAGPGQAAGDRLPAYGSRRESRERALSLLYEADAKSLAPADLLAELPVTPPPYVISIVAGVGERGHQIDQLIDRFAIDWTIDRMPVIDRTVVRMATFELLYRPDVPTGVVISEAVELAKRYSTDESGRFVNGLLASIASETRPAEGPLAG
ncbi:MAG TPA: transcription antitermination factor NusB [Acidimicrobiales bacterium]|nr:transcription antitermination factor NusB [Acidimicrobiales bacterium]